MKRSPPIGSIARLLAAALALGVAAAPARGATPVRLRLQLKWHHQFQFAGYYAAQSRGLYRDEGLEVEIVEGSPARPPLAMLAAGQAEMAVATGADALFHRLSGRPIVALAVVFQHSPAAVVTRRQDGILRPSDLVGRSLMITREQGEADLLAMFRREGVELDGVPGRSVRTRPTPGTSPT